jgi:hypothetical protein
MDIILNIFDHIYPYKFRNMLQKLRFTYKLFRYSLLFPHTYLDSSLKPKCPNMQILHTSYIYLSPYVIFLSSFTGNFFQNVLVDLHAHVLWLVDSDLISCTQCKYSGNACK